MVEAGDGGRETEDKRGRRTGDWRQELESRIQKKNVNKMVETQNLTFLLNCLNSGGIKNARNNY